MKDQKHILLAFSGGLDTTFCAVYLRKELGYKVSTVTINTGGFSKEDLKGISKKAMELGVEHHENIDATHDYYDQCVKYLVAGNILRNQTYPLSVSAERSFQALSIAKYAQEKKFDGIAHGSTGAGNDQVRFDLSFQIFCPQLQIITPIRDNKISRDEEITYLKDQGFNYNWETYDYSINKGLWGTSVGGVETLTSHLNLPESAYPTPVTQNEPQNLILSYSEGQLLKVNDEEFPHPVEAIQYLESIASAFGIGRDIHVGDTIIGIKGRVGFEAAAPMIIVKSHHSLEKHILTKHQLQMKDTLSLTYGNLVHEAMFLEPVMRDLEKFFDNTQNRVSGKVFLTLSPYRFQVDGIESKYDLMANSQGVYGEMNDGWTGDDVKGFTKILANQQKNYYSLK